MRHCTARARPTPRPRPAGIWEGLRSRAPYFKPLQKSRPGTERRLLTAPHTRLPTCGKGERLSLSRAGRTPSRVGFSRAEAHWRNPPTCGCRVPGAGAPPVTARPGPRHPTRTISSAFSPKVKCRCQALCPVRRLQPQPGCPCVPGPPEFSQAGRALQPWNGQSLDVGPHGKGHDPG